MKLDDVIERLKEDISDKNMEGSDVAICFKDDIEFIINYLEEGYLNNGRNKNGNY